MSLSTNTGRYLGSDDKVIATLNKFLSEDFDDHWRADGCQCHKAVGDNAFTFCDGTPTNNQYVCERCLNKCLYRLTPTLCLFDNGLTVEQHRENIKNKRIQIAKRKLGLDIDGV